MSDLSLTVQYKDKKVAGQFLTPLQTRDIPIITYNGNFNKLYTIIMYDPNAVNGNYIHFVNINILLIPLSHFIETLGCFPTILG